MANDVKLQEGHPIDSNLRPIKVGDESTSLEVATTNARVTGNLEVTDQLTVRDNIYINGDIVLPKTVNINLGEDRVIILTEAGESGNNFHFRDTCATFTQATAIFDATDTIIDFRKSNKFKLTLTADITDIIIYFPSSSGNFQILMIQDGTGGWDVTNWKAYDYQENVASGNSTLLWSGGSASTLTETANKADIISIYWDSADEKAYAVASENF